jgi:protein-S-isoprenylcysteine O-methyltransferase
MDLLTITGEIIRKTAMITAQASFTHLIKHQKRDVHVLITHGIYHYFRYTIECITNG